MNLNKWKLLLTVADCGSVTKAAAALRLNPSSISHQLSLLCRHYGARLYSRTSRGIELTEAGKIVIEELKILLAKEEDLVRRVSQGSHNLLNKSLKVGGSEGPSVSTLPVAVKLFQKTH